ncbi:MAG: hypothetical protein ACFBSE_23840 [Prochloraceae cyanobacterium]
MDLVISALKSESFTVQKAAYCLLRKRTEKKAIQAIKELNKYSFFECISTIKANCLTSNSYQFYRAYPISIINNI